MTVEISQVAIWASIASPIIAVIIAVLSGVSSRRATAKQLAAIEESTAKQVKSIKELTRLQLQISQIQLHNERTSASYQHKLVLEEINNLKKLNSSVLGTMHNDFTKEERRRREKEMDLHSKEDYYSSQISLIEGSLQKLNNIGKEVEKL
jgi:hypothetical protein